MRGWWRYSQLRPWQLVVPVVVGAISMALAILVSTKWWAILATYNLAYLVIALSVGSVRAERARRHGCW